MKGKKFFLNGCYVLLFCVFVLNGMCTNGNCLFNLRFYFEPKMRHNVFYAMTLIKFMSGESTIDSIRYPILINVCVAHLGWINDEYARIGFK